MHHSHATLTVTSLPSASYLTGPRLSKLRDSASAAKTEGPLAGICGTRGRLGRNPHWTPVVVSNRAFHWPPLTAPRASRG